MTTIPIDRLSSLLERFRVRAHLFHAGPLCGVTHFAARPGRGFLHVLLVIAVVLFIVRLLSGRRVV